LVVWRLDRLGRTLPQLIQTVEDLKARGIGFRSLTESIDTTTSAGQLIFHFFGALAEFARNLIRERTQASLAAARARGRVGGRRRLLDAKQIAQARTLYADPGNSVEDICRTLHVSRTTLWRYLHAGDATKDRENAKGTNTEALPRQPRACAYPQVTQAPPNTIRPARHPLLSRSRAARHIRSQTLD
jgi:DNA invertase Pin-like site-specific DNA recombinase